MYSFFQKYAVYAILIAGLIAVLKLKRIPRSYYPFLYFIWLGCVTELLARYSVEKIGSNAAIYNLYVLAEGVLLTWFLISPGIFNRARSQLLFVPVLISACWLLELWMKGGLGIRFGYYRVIYSLVIVMMSIHAISRLPRWPATWKKPAVIIIISFVVYFCFKILVEIFAVFSLTRSISFQMNLYAIMRVVNFIINLAYLATIILISRRESSGLIPVVTRREKS